MFDYATFERSILEHNARNAKFQREWPAKRRHERAVVKQITAEASRAAGRLNHTSWPADSFVAKVTQGRYGEDKRAVERRLLCIHGDWQGDVSEGFSTIDSPLWLGGDGNLYERVFCADHISIDIAVPFGRVNTRDIPSCRDVDAVLATLKALGT